VLTAESDGERILKICRHLPKLWTIKYRVVFFMKHPVVHIAVSVMLIYCHRQIFIFRFSGSWHVEV